jgi:hypothetical protein
MSTDPIDLDSVSREFLNQCAPHDFGMGGPCNCSERDYRSTMLTLVTELEETRRERDDARSSEVLTNVEFGERIRVAEAKLAEARTSMSKLMDKLDETSDGLGEWHDATEYVDWARREVRDAWLAAGGGQ